jgi:hypothetical protein
VEDNEPSNRRRFIGDEIGDNGSECNKAKRVSIKQSVEPESSKELKVKR